MRNALLFGSLMVFGLASGLPSLAQEKPPLPDSAIPSQALPPGSLPLDPVSPSESSESSEAPVVQMPDVERELTEIFAEFRKQFDEHRASVKAKDLRVAQQIKVIEYFMKNGQDAHDWIGSVKRRGTTPEGDAWISVEIADGVTVSTWQTRVFDRDLGTVIRPYSPLFAPAHNLKIGQPDFRQRYSGCSGCRRTSG